MSNYVTPRELTQYIGVDTLNGLIPVDAEPLADAAIARAEGVVNAYLAKHYETPVRPVGILRSITLSIAANELWQSVPGATIPEKVRQAHTDAMAHLTRITDGEIVLPNATRRTATTANTAAVYLSSAPSELDGF